LTKTLDDSKTNDRRPIAESRKLGSQQIKQRTERDGYEKHDFTAVLFRQLPARNLSDNISPEERRQNERFLLFSPVVVCKVRVCAVSISHRNNRDTHVHPLSVGDCETQENENDLDMSKAETL
jgi:hypothetical protein